ncbi:MAG: hypothetical protein MRZ79_17740 [Bacteroidia bacterium]|nr:hypothetical protein [Bacteroidia bacterium]
MDFLLGKDKGPKMEGVRFDTFNWKVVQEHSNIRVWQSEEFPAQLSLNYFNVAPDLPKDINKVDKLRNFYRKKLRKQKGCILDVEPLTIDQYEVIRTLFRVPQKNPEAGFIYVGSYTFPFADRSYVIKIQEQEFMNVGVREQMIKEKLLSERPEEVDGNGDPLGWEYDPYDSDYLGDIKMNKSEEKRFDLFFPDHPLSHVRQYMYRINNSFAFHDDLKSFEPLR